MQPFFDALVSASLALWSQAGADSDPEDRAFAHRLSAVALTEQKLERMAIAKESFAERELEPLPGFPFIRNLDDQIKAMETPAYASTFRIVGLTSREYVEGMQTVAIVCSGWADKKAVDVYFRSQLRACSAWPHLVTRILK